MAFASRDHRDHQVKAPPGTRGRSVGFTITELLVVIGIVAMLASLLLVVGSRVRQIGMASGTESTMQSFARAADAFFLEHGEYPGVIPETVVAEASASSMVWRNSGGAIGSLTSTENALLHLMGGYRVLPPGTPRNSPSYLEFGAFEYTHHFEIGPPGATWLLRVNINEIGEGPVINGRAHAPYLAPSSRQVMVSPGQVDDSGLPELVDAWGLPILYARRSRDHGPLVGPRNAKGPDRPQFMIAGLMPYLESQSLGTHRVSQETSILVTGDPYQNFAQVIRHPTFGSWNQSPHHSENRLRVRPRGEYVLISAGTNCVYFCQFDGPGSPGNPVSDLVEGVDDPKESIRKYTDIVIFGGG